MGGEHAWTERLRGRRMMPGVGRRDLPHLCYPPAPGRASQHPVRAQRKQIVAVVWGTGVRIRAVTRGQGKFLFREGKPGAFGK